MSLDQHTSANLANRQGVLDDRIDGGLERQRGMPSRWAGGATDVKRIQMVGGNTLATGQAGIKYASSEITSVPSAYDPEVDTSFIDGIGRGLLFVNGAYVGYVLVVNDGRSGSVINFDLLGGSSADIGDAGTVVDIPVSGGGDATVSCYVIGFI